MYSAHHIDVLFHTVDSVRHVDVVLSYTVDSVRHVDAVLSYTVDSVRHVDAVLSHAVDSFRHVDAVLLDVIICVVSLNYNEVSYLNSRLRTGRWIFRNRCSLYFFVRHFNTGCVSLA
jgi:hypothetical protein